MFDVRTHCSDTVSISYIIPPSLSCIFIQYFYNSAEIGVGEGKRERWGRGERDSNRLVSYRVSRNGGISV